MTNRAERRAEAVRRFRILDTTPEESFDAITRLASAICRAPFSALSFLDVDRQWFKSEVGLGLTETPLGQSFCKHTIQQDEPMVVCDAQADPRFRDNALVSSGPQLRFYAGCALKAPDGTPVGALCVLDTDARPQGLTKIERSALQVLARQVEVQLELRVAMRERDVQLIELEQLAEKLEFQSSHDGLTSLPNRSLFLKKLEQGLEECSRDGTSLSLMLLDVDHFKQTNDAFGHDAGDALLCGFGQSLQSAVRTTDTVARLGGDEFAILLLDVTAEGPDLSMIEKITERTRRSFRHRGRDIDCQASIGVSTYPKDAETGDALIRCSDLALAASKLSRGSAVVFDGALLERFDEQMRSVARIRAIVAADAFVPFYQPKIDLQTGQRVGFEALMRLSESSHAVSISDIFDPEFPDRPLVARIGSRMIDKIFDDMQGWIASGLDIGHIAINSCAADFAGDDFAEMLIAKLGARNISPSTVELEVTEGVLLGRGVSHIARAMRLLREAGIRIALDDFGTGYASLTHLRRFPVDVVKIDKSFIGGITHSVDDAAIVRAVIGLASNLGIATVAEGVETSAQEAFVRHHGCSMGQGYLYGKAVPASEIQNERSSQYVA